MQAQETLIPRVRMTDITKSFPGVKALSEVDLSLFAGEVHAVVGENGAGKSTLIKILTGALSKDSGTVRFNGQIVEINSTGKASDRKSVV